jgi:hypothetical protein
MVTSTLTLVGWAFLVSSWVIPYVMRKQANTFEERMKSYTVGGFLAAVALVFFVSDMIVHFSK